MSPTEVQEKLRLSQLKDKIWYVVPSCATTGEGLFEGLVIYAQTSERTYWLTFRLGVAIEQREVPTTEASQVTTTNLYDYRVLYRGASSLVFSYYLVIHDQRNSTD